jgi:type II secretory pathway component GspD/PulD (secretin)
MIAAMLTLKVTTVFPQQPSAQTAAAISESAAATQPEKPVAAGKAADENKEATGVVKRPSAPPRAPDPREFDVRPDKSGRIEFSFHGQPWPDLLQWLALVGGYSLDWQELPDDYINLSTERSYPVREACDLINRLLFERGFTMIVKGDVMSVVKIEKLDPSLLPRVEDELQLQDLQPYDFVKLAFQLPEKFKADGAAGDIKPLLSTRATVQPLINTNRLLVIDIVANLREVSRLINSEHAAAVGSVVPQEFHLRFARADQVADQVMVLLGLDPQTRRTPREAQQEMQLEQQRLQLFTQMQQRGTDVTKYLRKTDPPSVFLSVNQRGNSIVANAPPAEMEIIRRAVEMFDTPQGGVAGAEPAALSRSKYQLVTVNPQSVVSALTEIGDLDPRTRLKTDGNAKVIFAQATPADHRTIQSMIQSLDGSERKFEVIWLRRLPADTVATTVEKLMAGKADSNPGFKVDADVENNRLLLSASDNELNEVRGLLAKLGETPGRDGDPNTVRLLETAGGEETEKLLEQLRRTWAEVGSNELRIEGAPRTPVQGEHSQQSNEQSEPSARLEPPVANAENHIAVVSRRPQGPPLRLVKAESSLPGNTAGLIQQSQGPQTALSGGLAEPTGQEANGVPSAQSAGDGEAEARKSQARESGGSGDAAAPITITTEADGRLIFRSSDNEALDRLEDVLATISPPRKRHKVVYLKHAPAAMVTINLREYFEDEEKARMHARAGLAGGVQGFAPMLKPRASDQEPKIRFIWDSETNSILVLNASSAQLKAVEDLVQIYDRAPSENSAGGRRYQFFKLKYADAKKVADAIKDVHRDVLSAKDKEFDKPNRGSENQAFMQSDYYRIGFGSDSDGTRSLVKASFEGALSVGVDETSNTVIVFAEDEWMSSITEMIRQLDEAAAGATQTTAVVSRPIGRKNLQEILSSIPRRSGIKISVTKQAERTADEASAQVERHNGRTLSK